MVDDSVTFGFALFVMIAGMAVLLVGVAQGGDPLNALMIAGGVVFLVGVAIHTAGVLALEGGHGHDEDHATE
jgi:hypothetical protein